MERLLQISLPLLWLETALSPPQISTKCYRSCSAVFSLLLDHYLLLLDFQWGGKHYGSSHQFCTCISSTGHWRYSCWIGWKWVLANLPLNGSRIFSMSYRVNSNRHVRGVSMLPRQGGLVSKLKHLDQFKAKNGNCMQTIHGAQVRRWKAKLHIVVLIVSVILLYSKELHSLPSPVFQASGQMYHTDMYSIMSITRQQLNSGWPAPGAAVGRQTYGPRRSPATGDPAQSVPTLTLKTELMHLIVSIWMLFSWLCGNHKHTNSRVAQQVRAQHYRPWGRNPSPLASHSPSTKWGKY